MAKWNIKDGFWRLNCQEGEEWNFCYILPHPDRQSSKIVVPTSLQMRRIESLPFFCTPFEMGRDIAIQYTETPVSSLPMHKFIKYATTSKNYKKLPQNNDTHKFSYMLEVYDRYYTVVDVLTPQNQLDNMSNAISLKKFLE